MGVVASIPIEERFTTLKSEFTANMQVSMASHAAERLFFEDDVSTGPSHDLRNATQIAEMMIGRFGMGKDRVRVSGADPWNGALKVDPRAVDKVLQKAYAKTEELVYKYRDQIEVLALLLNAEGTVDGADVHTLLDRMTQSPPNFQELFANRYVRKDDE